MIDPPRTRTRLPAWLAESLACAGVVGAVLAAAYPRVVDAETFMRLAIGRLHAAGTPREDPFLFSVPGTPWRNPEWLADLLLYGVHRAGGEAALVALKLVVVSVGWLLLYWLGRRLGGSRLVLVALVALALSGAEWRLTERAEMHVYWLVPACGLLLLAARTDRRYLVAVPFLGVLWSNLHGSFPVAWVLVGAALGEALWGRARDRALARRLALVLGLLLLAPFAGPEGIHAYDLVIEHLRWGAFFKRAIQEWVPPERLPATLGQLPLHVLGMLGLASFLPRPNRREVQAFLLLAAGLAFAHGASRFLLLLGLLSIPGTAANLARAAAALPPRLAFARPVLGAAALVAAAALLAPLARATRATPAAADRVDFPVKAARWLGRHAPPGTRLMAPYTGSQWLMWEAPQVQLYIHPHLTYGGALMARYFGEIWPRPSRFEEEARRFEVGLALVDTMGESGPLFGHLTGAPHWRLIYLDDFFAIYAADREANRALVERFGYRAVRAGFGFEHLLAAPEDTVGPELDRLAAEAPGLHRAITAHRLLRAGPADAAGLARARDLLREARAALPAAPALFGYQVEAHLRLGERAEAEAVLREGLALFPRSTRLRALEPAVRAR